MVWFSDAVLSVYLPVPTISDFQAESFGRGVLLFVVEIPNVPIDLSVCRVHLDVKNNGMEYPLIDHVVCDFMYCDE